VFVPRGRAVLRNSEPGFPQCLNPDVRSRRLTSAPSARFTIKWISNEFWGCKKFPTKNGGGLPGWRKKKSGRPLPNGIAGKQGLKGSCRPNGYEATTLDAIAAAGRHFRAEVFYYLGSKEECAWRGKGGGVFSCPPARHAWKNRPRPGGPSTAVALSLKLIYTLRKTKEILIVEPGDCDRRKRCGGARKGASHSSLRWRKRCCGPCVNLWHQPAAGTNLCHGFRPMVIPWGGPMRLRRGRDLRPKTAKNARWAI